MNMKKVIGLSLTGVMLFSNAAFAAEVVNTMEAIKTVPSIAALQPLEKVNAVIDKEIKFEDKFVKYDIRLPEIQGLEDIIYQEQLNYIILSHAMEDIESVKSQAEELAAASEENGWEFRPFEISIDYEIKSNDGIMSLVVNTYTMTGGANGITRVDCYNIDTKENRKIELKDLFKDDVDYKEIVNKEIYKQIEEQKQKENKEYFEGELGFKTISDLQTYYIQDGNLVIVFP